MIEDKSTYAYQLRHLANPSFEKIRNLAKDFIMKLPEQLKDELYEEIERGEKQLETEPELMYYLHAFGKMHKAKLNYAFEHLPETFFEIPEINIIDYGCGQAVATMCYADFLRKQGYEQKIRRVTLIEPSEAALKRAALHVSVFFPDAEIVTINKGFDDLEPQNIVCDEDVPTLHLLSNVLDLECFRLITFKQLVKKRIGPSNLFVCVGPYFGDKDRGKHMDSFAKYFKGEEIFSEDLDANKLDANNSWTCMVRCFSVGDLDYSISDENLSTEVTVEDIENGIKDEYGVRYSKDGKRLLGAKQSNCKTYTIKKGVKVICNYAFWGCKSFQSIVIPNSLTNIGDGAFCSCYSLHSIFIPNSVTNIGAVAFAICESLQSLVIPTSVTSIGDSAFDLCESLQSIVIPTSVTSIGVNPFSRSGICSIVCHSKFFKVDGKALYDQNKKHLIAFYSNCSHFVIPDSVTSIGDSVFLGCGSLQSIIIPDSVTSIGNGAFEDCESLQSIVIPNSVTNIGAKAFSGCKSLRSIVIPNSVTNIGDSAFSGCDSLQSIVIPDSVTRIGDRAFSFCKSLQSIVIPNSVTSIGDSAFSSCQSLQSIVIPESVISIGANPYSYSGVRSIVSHSKFFTVDREALYDQKKKLLIACFSKGYHFVIPDNVTSIGDSAFSGCKSLQSIIIPESVTSIGKEAFMGCASLQSIVIPNSVTSIGVCAFVDCKSLRAIIIPKGSRKKFEKLLPDYPDYKDKLVEI